MTVHDHDVGVDCNTDVEVYARAPPKVQEAATRYTCRSWIDFAVGDVLHSARHSPAPVRDQNIPNCEDRLCCHSLSTPFQTFKIHMRALNVPVDSRLECPQV